jgi:hypothetical protein
MTQLFNDFGITAEGSEKELFNQLCELVENLKNDQVIKTTADSTRLKIDFDYFMKYIEGTEYYASFTRYF